LSGISGIVVGLTGLAAAVLMRWYLDYQNVDFFDPTGGKIPANTQTMLVFIASGAFIIALGLSVVSSVYRAKKAGQSAWTASSKQLLFHLFVPLAAGGIFCVALLDYQLAYLIAPSLLIFYGLALLNASKFTLREVKSLGLAEIVIGLGALFWPELGLYLWALGFGVLHVLNGVLMYYRYEK
jgi:hypothetical protein